jgi:hypothetical protein
MAPSALNSIWHSTWTLLFFKNTGVLLPHMSDTPHCGGITSQGAWICLKQLQVLGKLMCDVWTWNIGHCMGMHQDKKFWWGTTSGAFSIVNGPCPTRPHPRKVDHLTFETVWVKGKDNVETDTLSRHPFARATLDNKLNEDVHVAWINLVTLYATAKGSHWHDYYTASCRPRHHQW